MLLKIRGIQAWSLPTINEGILPKARKRKPRRWQGNPLKYKVQSEKQQWVNSSV